MASIKFLSENEVLTSSISVTTGVESAQFPLDNIKNNFTTKQARVTTIGGTCVLVFQLQTDEVIDTVAVVPDSITGFGYTAASVKTSLTADFTQATPVSIDIDVSLDFGIVTLTDTAPARFVEITFAGAAGFAEISKVFIGSAVNLDTSFSRESFSRTVNRNDVVTENPFGNRFVDIRNSRISMQGTLPLITAEQLLIIEDLFARHNGYLPIWVIVDENNDFLNDGKFRLSLYSYFNNIFTHGVVGGGFFNIQLDFVEAI